MHGALPQTPAHQWSPVPPVGLGGCCWRPRERRQSPPCSASGGEHPHRFSVALWTLDSSHNPSPTASTHRRGRASHRPVTQPLGNTLPQQMTDGPPPGLPHPGSPQPPADRGTPPPPGRRLAGGPLRTAVRHRLRGGCPKHAVMQRVARAGEANARRRRAGGRPRRAWRACVHHGPASSLHRVRAEMRRGHAGRAKGGQSFSYSGGSPARQLAAPSTAGNAPTVGARRGPIQRGS